MTSVAVQSEPTRLRVGMRVLVFGKPARVIRVNDCSALCRFETPRVRNFLTLAGTPVHIVAHGETVRISPDSECEVLA